MATDRIWIFSGCQFIDEFRKTFKHSFIINSKYIELLPSAKKMFRILRYIYNQKLFLVRYSDDSLGHNKLWINPDLIIKSDKLDEFVIFTFESEVAIGEFEQNIIREMGLYLDGLPPPYQI